MSASAPLRYGFHFTKCNTYNYLVILSVSFQVGHDYDLKFVHVEVEMFYFKHPHKINPRSEKKGQIIMFMWATIPSFQLEGYINYNS